MKYPSFSVAAVFLLTLISSSSGAKDEDNGTALIMENSSEIVTEAEKPDVVLSEDEIMLEKWRTFEMMLKDTSAKGVKSLLSTVLRFSEGISISPKCMNGLMKMIHGIKQMKTWAFKMLDASGKIPNGVINGYLTSLGDFDGCLSVDAPAPNPFRGQYCTVSIHPPLPKRIPFLNGLEIHPVFVNFSKPGTVMEEFVSNAQHFYQVQLRTSICVPSSCSREEIQRIADKIIAETVISWNITVPTCDVIEPLAFSKYDIAIMCVLSILVFVAFVATVTDVILYMIGQEKRLQTEESSTALKCLMCFSAYTNTVRLLKKDSSPDTIKFFHGMKFITILWVMLNHTYYYVNFKISVGLMNAKAFGSTVAFQVIANGFLNVETFFFISAVLVAYGRMRFAGEKLNVFLYIFRRLWRLTPPLMLVIFTSMLVPHLGSGPGWKETVGDVIDRCKKNWWTNLLYINNFISSEESCFQWLWYIPVDTHLYILALLVLIPLKSRPKLALGINALLFIAGTVATAAAHVYYEHHPLAIYVFSDPRDIFYFSDNSYFRTYTHVTTCCTGLYVGYILVTKPKLKIPLIWNILGWVISLALGLIVVYGVFDWNQGNVPGLGVSTLYMCTHKVAWALALSYVTIACFTGNGGVVTSILSWSAIVPFSRLTYVAYLIHPILQIMYVGSIRVPLYMDHKTTVYRYFGNIVASFSIAYILSLLFESPFMCLEKVLITGRASPQSKGESKPEHKSKFGNQPKCDENSISMITIKKIQNDVP